MNVPSGYSALDLVGFTDKGDYSASANYVKNDLVHYNDKIWKCLIDDTTGIAPTTGVNWDIWIDQSNSLDGLADVEITNAQDGQEITYDGTTQKWKNTSKIQTLTNQVKDMNNVYGSKNLLPNENKTQTKYGITYTVNPDGSIAANGKATSINGLYQNVTLKAGTYILSGCPSEGGGNKYYISIESLNVRDIGKGAVFTIDSEQTVNVTIARINNTTETYSDLVFYPMIRLASITDDTYEPYAKTNQQLTEDTTGLLDNTEVNGAVNMLPNNGITQVINGITFTVNDDGTVTASGTATAKATFYICSKNNHVFPDSILGKTVKISGSINTNNAYVQLFDPSANTVRKDTAFTMPSNMNSLSWNVIIEVTSGTTVNGTFYPMISVASYNGDYVPYAKSNRELTEEKLDISSLKTITAASSDFADFKTRIAAL